MIAVHPSASVHDVAISAYYSGFHIASRNGRACLEPGRDLRQYRRAQWIRTTYALTKPLRKTR